jgi:tRNA acetyltransferase TAN1
MSISVLSNPFPFYTSKEKQKKIKILKFIISFSFPFVFRVRNNSVRREDIIEPLADHIKKKFPEIKVDLDNPEACMVVEVIRTNCCIGVVENYFGRAKYNLVELAQKSK